MARSTDPQSPVVGARGRSGPPAGRSCATITWPLTSTSAWGSRPGLPPGRGPGRRRRGRGSGPATRGVLAVGVIASHLSRGGFLAMVVAGVVRPGGPRHRTVRLGVGRVWPRRWSDPCVSGRRGDALPLRRLGTIVDACGERPGRPARLEIWAAAARAWMHTRSGGRAWGPSGRGRRPPSSVRDAGRLLPREENEYLEMLVEAGIVGLGLALLRWGDRPAGPPTSWPRASPRSGPWSSAPVRRPGPVDPVAGRLSPAHPGGRGRGSDPLRPPLPAGPGGAARGEHVWGGGAGRSRRAARPGGSSRCWRGGRWSRWACCPGNGSCLARAEAMLAGAGLPLPGSGCSSAAGDAPEPVLQGPRAGAARTIVAVGPDWAEGAPSARGDPAGALPAERRRWIGPGRPDSAAAACVADPLWLHGVIHSPRRTSRRARRAARSHEPVRLYLVPAARTSWRRGECFPVLALPHARLAGLDFLLEGGDPANRYAEAGPGQAGAPGTSDARRRGSRSSSATSTWRREMLAAVAGGFRRPELGGGRRPAVALLAPERSSRRSCPPTAVTRSGSPTGSTPAPRTVQPGIDSLRRAVAVRADAAWEPGERLQFEAQARAAARTTASRRGNGWRRHGAGAAAGRWPTEFMGWLSTGARSRRPIATPSSGISSAPASRRAAGWAGGDRRGPRPRVPTPPGPEWARGPT